MRIGAGLAGLAAWSAGLAAPCVAGAASPPSAPADATLPLWIDPQLLGPPTSSQAAPPPRFTVTRVGPGGVRSTEAIDAAQLQALSHAAVATPAPATIPVEPPPRQPSAPPSAAATLSGSDAAALRAAAKRLTLEPTWTALARRSLAAGEAAPAPVRDPRTKPDGKAALGLRDGRRYGEAGRFYMYAAMKNRGVGMNVVDRGESWGGDGLSYDQGGFAGQRSAGIGWRQGQTSTSLGWVHQKTPINGLYGAPAEKDDRLALTFTWRPKVPETPPPSK